MKLAIREYLASLKEREELDAILPDLLSEMGLTVFSSPKRGMNQYGVDVATFGSLNGEPEKVYLFSVKAGNLGRSDWHGTDQSLHPSLIDILDVYIPNHIPSEYRNKPVAICICIGGAVLENVRLRVTAFENRHSTDTVEFQEWNGDLLASLILDIFLKEELLPPDAQPFLRKAIALIDEPEASYQHFKSLLNLLIAPDNLKSDKKKLRATRQMSISLWMIFSWARPTGNTEAAYLCSELALLYAWSIFRGYIEKKGKIAQDIADAFNAVATVYQQITSDFLAQNVVPHVDTLHGLSSAIRGHNSLDTNLKLFDLLGRLAIDGAWAYWASIRVSEESELVEQQQKLMSEAIECAKAIHSMIYNNNSLLNPVRDDHSIEISMALGLFASIPGYDKVIGNWLEELIERATFAHRTHKAYPCTTTTYIDLLDHPIKDDEYRKKVTRGSTLYPLIAIWAGLYDHEDTYQKVVDLKNQELGHCNFQYWYPDESTEEHFYTHSGQHGAALCDICIGQSSKDVLDQVFGECDENIHFDDLTAVKYGWWPIILVACRHYRLPVPLHLAKGLRNPLLEEEM